MLAIAGVLGACQAAPYSSPSITLGPSSGTPPSPRPSASAATPTTAPPSPSAAVATATGAAPSVSASLPPESGDLFPGTYKTPFEPPLTLIVGHEVDLDCAPGYRCRGEVNVNLPSWVALDFGHDHGAEINFIRLDQVFDPASGRVVDAPDDLATWIATLPGFTVVKSLDVTVGGVAAKQLDVRTGSDTTGEFGPIPGIDEPHAGIGPDALARLIVLRVEGHQVLITVGVDPDNTVHDFDAAVASLQPLIDSIEWR